MKIERQGKDSDRPRERLNIFEHELCDLHVPSSRRSCLAIQFAVNIFDLAAALDEALVRLKSQSVALTLCNNEVQCLLDSLSLGLRTQSFLNTLDLRGVQTDMRLQAGLLPWP